MIHGQIIDIYGLMYYLDLKSRFFIILNKSDLEKKVWRVIIQKLSQLINPIELLIN